MSKPAFGNSAILCYAAFDCIFVANVDYPQFDRKYRCHRLQGGPLPNPGGSKGSRRTAACVVAGAICLSNSSHFAGMLYSNWGKAGDVASRPGEQAFDDTEADRVDRLSKYDRNAAIRLE